MNGRPDWTFEGVHHPERHRPIMENGANCSWCGPPGACYPDDPCACCVAEAERVAEQNKRVADAVAAYPKCAHCTGCDRTSEPDTCCMPIECPDCPDVVPIQNPHEVHAYRARDNEEN